MPKTGARKLLFEHAPEQLTAPRIKGETAYYLGSDVRTKHTLYAFDTVAGKMLWQASSPEGNAFAPPIVSDKYVAYVSNYAVLYVYDLDGKLIFKKSLRLATAFNQFNDTKKLAVIGGETVFLSEGYSVSAYDLANGKQKWQLKFSNSLSNLAVGAESVFVGSADENLYALNRETGEITWKQNVMGTPPYSGNSVYVDGGLVYYANGAEYVNLLQAYDAAHGNLVWERIVRETEMKLGGDYVYAKNVGKVFNQETGKSAFYANLLEVRKFSLIDASENSVILARENTETPNKLTLTAIDRKNKNKILWRIDFSEIDLKPIFDPKSTGD